VIIKCRERERETGMEYKSQGLKKKMYSKEKENGKQTIRTIQERGNGK